ncbi:MAG: LysR family transcriptional regulator [Rhodospirillales bacterium]|nr:LysR family transcriptional regulator [Rhodospirillales bacterium]
MDLRQFEHFLVVFELGSFGKAAKQLQITQSGLTKSIQSLEQSVGANLFVRHTRGVNPTKFGASLSQHARLILAQSKNAKREIQALKDGLAGKLEVGIAAAWLMEDKLSKIISGIIQSNPGLILRIYSQVSSRKLFEQLLQGKLDIVIGTEQYAGIHPDCNFIHLKESIHGIVVRKGHPLLKKKKISISHFKDFNWVMREPGSFYRQQLEGLYREANRPFPRPLVETNSISLTVATVADTDYLGAARLADIGLSGRENVVLLKKPFQWKRNIAVMHRQGEPLSKTGEKFIKSIVMNFHSL